MNFLNNTKLIYKSVLDLVPAVLLAIIVAIIAGFNLLIDYHVVALCRAREWQNNFL